jgi:hypothetical protein
MQLHLLPLLLLLLLLLPSASAALLDGAPIWASSPNDFALLRGPAFSLRAPPSSATFFYAAQGSPRPPAGTTQAKLLGAACIHVNNILVSCGPGHNVPTATQVVRGVNVLPFLRGGGAPNVVGVASFFAHAYSKGDRPAVQGVLAVTDAQGSYNVSATGDGWLGWGADAYFNPTGNAGVCVSAAEKPPLYARRAQTPPPPPATTTPPGPGTRFPMRTCSLARGHWGGRTPRARPRGPTPRPPRRGLRPSTTSRVRGPLRLCAPRPAACCAPRRTAKSSTLGKR